MFRPVCGGTPRAGVYRRIQKRVRDIADELCISRRTIELIAPASFKPDLHGNQALMKFALEHKIIHPLNCAA
jgi:hypothetical protein